MARRQRDQQACDELAAHLAVQYATLPYPKPSWPEMSKTISAQFGIDVTDETLRQMHAGTKDPGTINPEFLIGVAKFYGINSADLGATAAARLGNLLELVQNWKMLSPAA